MPTQQELDAAVNSADASAEVASSASTTATDAAGRAETSATSAQGFANAAAQSATDAAAEAKKAASQAVDARLTPKIGTRAFDPDLTANIETNMSADAPAATSGGPQRFTICVPYHDTVLSLGKGSPNRIAHDGITGKTKDHIHFRVTDGGGSGTFVGMGNSGGALSMLSYTGTDITALLGGVGYTMTTAGRSWQASKGKYSIVSQSGVLVSAESGTDGVLIQAQEGPADVFAATQVTLASPSTIAIVANSQLTRESHANADQWKNAIGSTAATIYAQYGLTAASSLADAVSWFMSIGLVTPPNGAADSNAADWKAPTRENALLKPKVLIDAANLTASTAFGFDSVENAGGATSIGLGATYISINAANQALLYGHLGSSVASPLNAGILAGLSASVKAAYVGLIAAKEVAAISVKDAKMEGMFGEASVRAKKDVQVTSSNGSVVVQSQADARISSVNGAAYVYGKTETTVAAGKDSGYALYVSGTEGAFGKLISAPKDAKTPTFQEAQAISVSDDAIWVRHNNAAISLTGDSIQLLAKNKSNVLKVDDNFEFDASSTAKILLG